MKITFWGAAKEVTGSKHVLEVNRSKYLLDCGMFQGGSREMVNKKNKELIFDPKDFEAILISHAHIDHTGLLPYFVKNGFSNKIFATEATYDLCSHMLLDSAHISELENGANLYSQSDIPTVLDLFQTVEYEKKIKIDNNISVIYHDAGHVLGSAILEIFITENNEEKILIFTGDLGRKDLPILRDPTYLKKADFVITESTYGDRDHDSVDNMSKSLEDVINRVYERNGKIIIPSFSLERTQEIIYLLHLLTDENKIPDIPIFVDSPLTFNLTRVFQKHPECFDQETFDTFLQHKLNPFGFGKLRFVQSVGESKSLNNIKNTCIIISASGMCEGGRIMHHLYNNVEKKENMILFVGFQAQGTLGRKLLERHKSIKLLRAELKVNAEIKILNSFSAHADKEEIINWLSKIEKIEKLFLVHGEEKQLAALKNHIREKDLNVKEIFIPEKGEEYILN